MSIHEHVSIISQRTSRILVKMNFYPWVCCLTICLCLFIREKQTNSFYFYQEVSCRLVLTLGRWQKIQPVCCFQGAYLSWGSNWRPGNKQPQANDVTGGTSDWHVFSCGILNVYLLTDSTLLHLISWELM